MAQGGEVRFRLPSLPDWFNLLLSPTNLLVGWVIYFVIYAIALVKLMGSREMETNERILWFLVITMAPVIGLILFFAGRTSK